MSTPPRIYAQYADKPKAVSWYAITPTIAQEITDAASAVTVSYDIDTQEGVQLDIIGAIVNAPRGPLTSDIQYRLFLKAAIVRNNSDATIDGIIRGLNFILSSADSFILYDYEDMSFGIDVTPPVSPVEITTLLSTGIVPKPQGVRFRGVIFSSLLTSCGNIPKTTFGNTSSQCRGYFAPTT